MRRVLVASGRGFREFITAIPNDEAFKSRFGSERACRDFLFQSRWPDGFECPRCGPAAFRWLDSRRMRCLCCHKNTHLTGGTILHRTRKPLALWFRAAFLMAQHGASARTLSQELQLTFKVAWMWGHKLRKLMELKTTVDAAVPPWTPPPRPSDPPLGPCGVEYLKRR